MKILLLSPYPPPAGGIATWTKNLITYARVNGSRHEIIHQNTVYNLKEITRVDLWSRIIVGIRELRLIIRNLKTNVINHDPDIIHLASSASLAMVKDFFILRVAGRRGIPVVIHWRFGRIPELAVKRNWEWRLLCLIIRRSALSVVIDAKSFRTLTGKGFNNILKIPNVLGLRAQGRMDLTESFMEGKKAGSVLYVGHLIRKKGVYELVTACSGLPEVKELVMVGHYEKNIMMELSEIAGERDGGRWLNIIGEVEEDVVHRLMKEASLLVLPSYTEGFPNVIIEAMAMGCAVIGTEVGAIPEIINVSSENPCGICVPAGKVEELKNAIHSLLQSPGITRSMGRSGIDRVLANYTIEKVMLQYHSAWEQAYAAGRNLSIVTA